MEQAIAHSKPIRSSRESFTTSPHQFVPNGSPRLTEDTCDLRFPLTPAPRLRILIYVLYFFAHEFAYPVDVVKTFPIRRVPKVQETKIEESCNPSSEQIRAIFTREPDVFWKGRDLCCFYVPWQVGVGNILSPPVQRLPILELFFTSYFYRVVLMIAWQFGCGKTNQDYKAVANHTQELRNKQHNPKYHFKCFFNKTGIPKLDTLHQARAKQKDTRQHITRKAREDKARQEKEKEKSFQ